MKTILLTLTILVTTNLSANWKVTDTPAKVVTTQQKTASITNVAGDTFSVYRAHNGSVWCSFKIANSRALKPYWNKAPTLVIDGSKPIDLKQTQNTQSLLGIYAYDWTMDQVNFRVSSSDTEHLISDTLFELMRGDQLVIHYALRSGKRVSSTFSLKEASTAIAETLGITPETDTYSQKRKKDFNIALITENTECRLNTEITVSCLETSNLCAELTRPDIQQYKTCLEQTR